ncbi:hypothetical protein AYX13_05713 [Cryptococcus neoformans]|nr:hypothetical protein AYX13_05713 [Cryptococcus neoformans var. grubii]
MDTPGAGPSRQFSSTPAANNKLDPDVKPGTVLLTSDLLSSFQPAKRFKDAVLEPTSTPSGPKTHSVTTLTFDDTGDRLISAGDDNQFILWDARKGKKIKSFYSKKYGIDHVRSTHKTGTILHASTQGGDHAVRYHSTHDNAYLAYFKGHTARVRSIDMSPADDSFVTAGDDGTVRLWDLRANACKGLVNDVGGSAIAAMDNTGVVFAVACSDTQTIMMYATKTADVHPFIHQGLIDIALEDISTPPPKPIFTSLHFSNNGQYLLVGTSSDVHYVLDAIYLTPLRRLVGHSGLERDAQGNKGVEPRRGISGEELCWTADSSWVISGSANGEVIAWDLRPEPGQSQLTRSDVAGGNWHTANPPDWTTLRIPDLKPKVVLHGDGAGSGPTRAVKFNPRYNLMAVGGYDLVSLSILLLGATVDERKDIVDAHKGRRGEVGRRRVVDARLYISLQLYVLFSIIMSSVAQMKPRDAFI